MKACIKSLPAGFFQSLTGNRDLLYAAAYDLRMLENILQELQKKTGIMACFKALFTHIQEYSEFYNIYLNQTRNVGAIGVAWDLLKDYIEQIDYRKFGFCSEKEKLSSSR